MTKQCQFLKVSQSLLYNTPVGINAETLELINEIGRVFKEYSFFGSRRIEAYLQKNGFHSGCHLVRRLMGKVLTWLLSNTLDASFCLEALNDDITKYGKPEIMNADSHMMITSSRVVCLKH